MGKDYKAIAKSYEQKARQVDRDSMKGGGQEYNRPTFGQVSKMYEEAGDAWFLAKNPGNAKINYGMALKNSHVNYVKNRIKHKIEKLSSHKKIGLEKYFPVLAIGSFIGALFFLSFNLTGNAVGELTYEGSNLISLSLFFLGLVFAFFYFKNKK